MADGTIKIGVDLDQKGFETQVAGLSKSITAALGATSVELNALGKAVDKAYADGIAEGRAVPENAARAVVGQVRAAALAAVNEQGFSSVGTQMMNGVASGIRNGTSAINAAIQSAANAAKSTFQSAMKIQSPSKVMAEEGLYVALGVAKGIEDGITVVELATERVADAVKSMLSGAELTAYEANVSALVKTYNFLGDQIIAALKEKYTEELKLQKASAKAEAEAAQDAADALYEIRKQAINDQIALLVIEEKEKTAALNAEIAALKKQADEYKFLGDRLMEALKNRYREEYDLQLGAIRAEADAAQDAADALYKIRKQQTDDRIALLKQEESQVVASLQAQIDAIDREAKAEAEAKRAAEDASKIVELQAAVDRAKNVKFQTAAQEALDKEIAKQAEEQRARDREAEKEALKAEISQLKENYAAEQALEEAHLAQMKDGLDAEKQAVKDSLTEQESYYKVLYAHLTDQQRLNAEAMELMLADSNEDMLALLDQYNPGWRNAGKTFGDLFTEGLKGDIDRAKDEIEQLKDNYDAQRALEKQRLEALSADYQKQTADVKSNLDVQLTYYESYYGGLLSKQALNEEAKRLLLLNSNDEMIALLDTYNPDWYNAGKTFGELFVAGLGADMGNIEKLLQSVSDFAQGKIDSIKAQVASLSSMGSYAADVVSEISIIQASNAPQVAQRMDADAGLSAQSITINMGGIEFNQPVQSPAETARAISISTKELAYDILI